MSISTRSDSSRPAQPASRGEDSLSSLLDKGGERILKALPNASRMTEEDKKGFVQRLSQTVSLIAFKNPRLGECKPASLLAAVVEACQLDLDLNPQRREAYLVPFWNKNIKGFEAVFQPGYMGLLKLARRSGEIKNIVTRAVYPGDEFDYIEENTQVTYRYKQCSDDTERGENPIQFYAAALLTNGSIQFQVMSRKAVDRIRNRSQAKDNGPWVTDYDAMGQKTVLKQLAKMLPQSTTQLLRALDADDREYNEAMEAASASVVASVTTPSSGNGRGVQSLAERLGSVARQAAEPEVEPVALDSQADTVQPYNERTGEIIEEPILECRTSDQGDDEADPDVEMEMEMFKRKGGRS